MKKHLMMFVLLMVTGLLAIGQTVQITGMVTSSEDGLPMPGVTVKVQGLTIGVVTGNDGLYNLQVPGTATALEFSFIGMQNQVVPINGRTRINVTLMPDLVAMDEVIVIAYGTAKKESLTGSAAVIDSKTMESRSVSSVAQILTGSTTGVQTTAGSGQPGSSPSIIIRGVGTLNTSTDPLIVLDGSEYSGSLASINPSDISSMTILKDASSTALYGSRAANGVILISTKQGTKGSEALKVTLKAQGGVVGQALPYYPSVNAFDYYELSAEAFAQSRFNSGLNPTIETARAYAYSNIFGQLAYNPFVGTPNNEIVGADGLINPNAKIGFPDLDWYEPSKQTGYRQNYDLNLQGGSKKASYFYSLGYLDERGYTIKSDFERINTRLNISYDVKDWLQIGSNLYGTLEMSDVGTSESATYANPFRNARMTAPIYPVFLVDQLTGEYILDGADEKQYDDGGLHSRPINIGRNAIAELNWNSDEYNRNNFGDRIFARFTIIEGLTATVNASVDLQSYQYKGFENPKIGDGAPTARMDETRYTRTSVNFNQLINYEKTYNGVHNFSAMIGHEAYSRKYTYQRGFKNQFIVTGIYELNNFVNTSTNTSYTTNKTVEGYFGRLKYNYDGKYYVEGSYRKDGSSAFHESVRWGDFFSVGAGWSISQEQFMQNLTWIDNLKLRTSYGEVGSDNIGTYGYQALYGTRPNGTSPGIRWEDVGNEALTWEVNKTFDVALDFSIFKRIDGSVEWYHRKSDDLLYDMPLAPSMGLLSQPRNIASMLNSGLEIRLGFDVINTNDFKWNITFMASTLKNEITSIPDPFVNGSKRWSVGSSIYDFWLRKFYDIDPADGATRFHVWEDVSDDEGKITGSQLAYTDDGEPVLTKDQNAANYGYVGASAFPDLQGSIANSLSYKGFTLTALFTYSLGGQMLDGIYQGMMAAVPGESFHPDNMNAWKNPGDVTNIPRLQYSNTHLYATSDYFLISSDYLNIRNITLNYDLPKQITSRLGVGQLGVFTTVENLYMFTAREGLNPTFNFNGTQDGFAYLPSRSIIFGINLQF
ncbi:MAG: TonB-dependent receptor [Bacteroidales bacterium]|nr:TonB-dependent receptor [Bacteroidales bacterium]